MSFKIVGRVSSARIRNFLRTQGERLANIGSATELHLGFWVLNVESRSQESRQSVQNWGTCQNWSSDIDTVGQVLFQTRVRHQIAAVSESSVNLDVLTCRDWLRDKIKKVGATEMRAQDAEMSLIIRRLHQCYDLKCLSLHLAQRVAHVRVACSRKHAGAGKRKKSSRTYSPWQR